MSGPAKSLSVFDRVATAQEIRIRHVVLDWGIQLRLWVATCVTGLSLFSIQALGVAQEGTATTALAVIFFATLALYNLDGGLDAPKAPARSPRGSPERGVAPANAAARDRRRRLHLAFTGFSGCVLLVLASRLSPRALLLTSGGALICSVYAVPLTRTRRSSDRGFRLKALPFLKAPFVGCAVGTATVWVPLWAGDGRVQLSRALALTCALSFYCTANALLCDVPDIDEDERTGVPTLPLRWGLAGTRWTSRALITAGVLISAVFAGQGTPSSHSIGLFCLGAGLLTFTELIDFRTPRRTVAVWVDGALLLPVSFQLLVGS